MARQEAGDDRLFNMQYAFLSMRLGVRLFINGRATVIRSSSASVSADLPTKPCSRDVTGSRRTEFVEDPLPGVMDEIHNLVTVNNPHCSADRQDWNTRYYHIDPTDISKSLGTSIRQEQANVKRRTIKHGFRLKRLKSQSNDRGPGYDTSQPIHLTIFSCPLTGSSSPQARQTTEYRSIDHSLPGLSREAP
jgi:hypothetical protein